MCAKELNIWVLMIQERYDKPPGLWSSLHFKQFVLQATLIIYGLIGRVSLLYYLCSGLAWVNG